jgi:hypothetical protein
MASAVNLSASRQESGGLLATRTACPPLLSIDRAGENSCHDFNQSIIEFLADRPDIKTVILAARWAFSINGTRYKNESGKSITLQDVTSPDMSDAGNSILFERGLRRTVDALAELDKNIVFVTQVPEIGHDVPSASYSARLTGRDVNTMIAPSIEEYRERTAGISVVFDVLRAERPITIVDPAELLCDSKRCSVLLDGTPLYRDDDHLSLRGCVLVSTLFDKVLAGSTAVR